MPSFADQCSDLSGNYALWQRIPYFPAQCVVDGVYLARFTKVGHVWNIPTISQTECIPELLFVHVNFEFHNQVAEEYLRICKLILLLVPFLL